MVGYTNVYWHLFFNISQKVFYLQAKHLKIFSWNNFMCKPNKGNHFSVYFLEHSQTRKKKKFQKMFSLENIFIFGKYFMLNQTQPKSSLSNPRQ